MIEVLFAILIAFNCGSRNSYAIILCLFIIKKINLIVPDVGTFSVTVFYNKL